MHVYTGSSKAVWDWGTNQLVGFALSERGSAEAHSGHGAVAGSVSASGSVHAEDGVDDDGECKACMGMHRAHTCAAKRALNVAGAPSPSMPPQHSPSPTLAQGGGGAAQHGRAASAAAAAGMPGNLTSADPAASTTSTAAANKQRSKPKFKVPTMKELSPYQLGCHLDEDESPFSLVQPLCYEDYWVVFRTPGHCVRACFCPHYVSDVLGSCAEFCDVLGASAPAQAT